MRTFDCLCGNVLFFDNSRCLACGRDVGFCPACRRLVALVPDGDAFRCGNAACGVPVAKCLNYAEHDVCNWCVPAEATGSLCDRCRFTETIPDLSVPGNSLKWYRLEAAKRRLFYDLDRLGLPYGTRAEGFDPPLAFDFKADVIPAGDFWRSGDAGEKVYTGHANGRITINLREADDVEREKLRVDFGEAHRTLVGHFRHEIGHYYWDALVKGRREPEFKAAFGDHESPTYADALDAYYKSGPPADWPEWFVSAYATMHPWEDFAETWAAYLAMTDVLDTARCAGFAEPADPSDLDAMVVRYQRLGLAVNEINRSMGLLDAVPHVFVSPVVAKLRFVHRLVARGPA